MHKEIGLNYISSFICAKKLQKNKKCEDFEVRFCCPNLNESLILSPDPNKPVFDDEIALQELKDINDLRKLNT